MLPPTPPTARGTLDTLEDVSNVVEAIVLKHA